MAGSATTMVLSIRSIAMAINTKIDSVQRYLPGSDTSWCVPDAPGASVVDCISGPQPRQTMARSSPGFTNGPAGCSCGTAWAPPYRVPRSPVADHRIGAGHARVRLQWIPCVGDQPVGSSSGDAGGGGHFRSVSTGRPWSMPSMLRTCGTVQANSRASAVMFRPESEKAWERRAGCSPG